MKKATTLTETKRKNFQFSSAKKSKNLFVLLKNSEIFKDNQIELNSIQFHLISWILSFKNELVNDKYP